jgi:hypothetical protein
MIPSDDHSSDPLDALLAQWKAPATPLRLNTSLSKAYRRSMTPRGVRWFLTGSLRIPVPLAFVGAVAALLLISFFVRHIPAPSQSKIEPTIVVETQKIEVPVIRERLVVRYRKHPRNGSSSLSSTPKSQSAPDTYQFVTALVPHIVRKDHEAQN